MALNDADSPSFIESSSEFKLMSGFLTTSSQVAETLSTVAVIVAVPFLMAVIIQSGLIIATLFLLDFQVGLTPEDTSATSFVLWPLYSVIFFWSSFTVGYLTLILQLALLPFEVAVMVVSPVLR